MLSKLSVYILSFFLLLILYMVFFYDITYETRPLKDTSLPDFEFENVVISHFNDGELEFEVSANRALIYKDSNLLQLDTFSGVRGVTHNHFIRFVANSGGFNLLSSELTLNDSYLIFNYFFDYTWMYSKKMVWNSLTKQLYSTSNTTVDHQNYVIKTTNMRYDVDRAKLYLNDYPNINIRLHHD